MNKMNGQKRNLKVKNDIFNGTDGVAFYLTTPKFFIYNGGFLVLDSF